MQQWSGCTKRKGNSAYAMQLTRTTLYTAWAYRRLTCTGSLGISRGLRNNRFRNTNLFSPALTDCDVRLVLEVCVPDPATFCCFLYKETKLSLCPGLLFT